MGLNPTNLKKIKEAFAERFPEVTPEISGENQYGCECIAVSVEEGITLRELVDLKEGVHNTMSLSSDEGKLRIAVW